MASKRKISTKETPPTEMVIIPPDTGPSLSDHAAMIRTPSKKISDIRDITYKMTKAIDDFDRLYDGHADSMLTEITEQIENLEGGQLKCQLRSFVGQYKDMLMKVDQVAEERDEWFSAMSFGLDVGEIAPIEQFDEHMGTQDQIVSDSLKRMKKGFARLQQINYEIRDLAKQGFDTRQLEREKEEIQREVMAGFSDFASSINTTSIPGLAPDHGTQRRSSFMSFYESSPFKFAVQEIVELLHQARAHGAKEIEELERKVKKLLSDIAENEKSNKGIRTSLSEAKSIETRLRLELTTLKREKEDLYLKTRRLKKEIFSLKSQKSQGKIPLDADESSEEEIEIDSTLTKEENVSGSPFTAGADYAKVYRKQKETEMALMEMKKKLLAAENGLKEKDDKIRDLEKLQQQLLATTKKLEASTVSAAVTVVVQDEDSIQPAPECEVVEQQVQVNGDDVLTLHAMMCSRCGHRHGSPKTPLPEISAEIILSESEDYIEEVAIAQFGADVFTPEPETIDEDKDQRGTGESIIKDTAKDPVTKPKKSIVKKVAAKEEKREGRKGEKTKMPPPRTPEEVRSLRTRVNTLENEIRNLKQPAKKERILPDILHAEETQFIVDEEIADECAIWEEEDMPEIQEELPRDEEAPPERIRQEVVTGPIKSIRTPKLLPELHERKRRRDIRTPQRPLSRPPSMWPEGLDTSLVHTLTPLRGIDLGITTPTMKRQTPPSQDLPSRIATPRLAPFGPRYTPTPWGNAEMSDLLIEGRILTSKKDTELHTDRKKLSTAPSHLQTMEAITPPTRQIERHFGGVDMLTIGGTGFSREPTPRQDTTPKYRKSTTRSHEPRVVVPQTRADSSIPLDPIFNREFFKPQFSAVPLNDSAHAPPALATIPRRGLIQLVTPQFEKPSDKSTSRLGRRKIPRKSRINLSKLETSQSTGSKQSHFSRVTSTPKRPSMTPHGRPRMDLPSVFSSLRPGKNLQRQAPMLMTNTKFPPI